MNESLFALEYDGTSNKPYWVFWLASSKGVSSHRQQKVGNEFYSQSVILISSSFHKNRISLHHCSLDTPSESLFFGVYPSYGGKHFQKSVGFPGKEPCHIHPGITSLGWISQELGLSKCLLNWTISPSLSLSLLCTFPIALVLSSGDQLLFTSLHPGFLWIKKNKEKKLVPIYFLVSPF